MNGARNHIIVLCSTPLATEVNRLHDVTRAKLPSFSESDDESGSDSEPVRPVRIVHLHTFSSDAEAGLSASGGGGDGDEAAAGVVVPALPIVPPAATTRAELRLDIEAAFERAARADAGEDPVGQALAEVRQAEAQGHLESFDRVRQALADLADDGSGSGGGGGMAGSLARHFRALPDEVSLKLTAAPLLRAPLSHRPPAVYLSVFAPTRRLFQSSSAQVQGAWRAAEADRRFEEALESERRAAAAAEREVWARGW